MHFGFPGNRASDFLFILCLLYVGESQSISEANNSGLQTQQCPVGQVAGNPCRERFNSERTVTLTSASEEEDQSVNRAAYIKPESE